MQVSSTTHEIVPQTNDSDSKKTEKGLEIKLDALIEFIAYGIFTVPVLAVVTAGFTSTTIASASLFVAAVCLTATVHAICILITYVFIYTFLTQQTKTGKLPSFLTQLDNKVSAHWKISTHSDLTEKLEKPPRILLLIEKIKFCFLEFVKNHLKPLLISMIGDGVGLGVTYLCGLSFFYMLPGVIGPFLILLRATTALHSVYKDIHSKLTRLYQPGLELENNNKSSKNNIENTEKINEDNKLIIEDVEIEDINNFKIIIEDINNFEVFPQP